MPTPRRKVPIATVEAAKHKELERSPLQSKKFVAAMLWNMCWLILIGYGIYSDTGDSVLLSMVLVSGSTQIVYVGGQAALDTFVRQAFHKSNGTEPAKSA
tara:strand:+ start:21312 stop:21611 length:300 start_codon:yes stop_codon:yes gene_type:complete